MTSCSDHMANARIKQILDRVERSAYCSGRDGCWVALVKCDECARMFEEELETARAKIVSGVSLLCLACDGEAMVPAFFGVKIQISWDWG